ncbi:MAG: hypothetical protein ACK56G_04475 [Pirellulaceae bacterium]
MPSRDQRVVARRQPVSQGHVAEEDPQRVAGKKTNRSIFGGLGQEQDRDAGESQIKAADVEGCHQHTHQLRIGRDATEGIGMGDSHRVPDSLVVQ